MHLQVSEGTHMGWKMGNEDQEFRRPLSGRDASESQRHGKHSQFSAVFFPSFATGNPEPGRRNDRPAG